MDTTTHMSLTHLSLLVVLGAGAFLAACALPLAHPTGTPPARPLHNTARGTDALGAVTTGTANTALGAGALRRLTAGASNVALGADTLAANTTGSFNTALGNVALLNTTTGTGNVALGFGAGDTLTTGSDNILLGTEVEPPDPATNHHLNIGNTLYADLETGQVGIGTAAPHSALHVPASGYLQAEHSTAGSPPAADCDSDAERGRQSLDTRHFRLYHDLEGLEDLKIILA